MHTTGSFFDLFEDQIVDILGAGLDVVSTSEELSFPWLAHPEEAARIDAAADGSERQCRDDGGRLCGTDEEGADGTYRPPGIDGDGLLARWVKPWSGTNPASSRS